MSTQQQAYLHTMGISLWQDQAVVSARIVRVDLQILERLDWNGLADQVMNCVACDLHQGRSQAILGVGDPQADLLIITDAPTVEDDRLAEPFSGNAGQLFNGMLKAIGFNRQAVFITNIVKCHPVSNRAPSSEECECCLAYLYRQIEWIQPRLVLATGVYVAQRLLRTEQALDKLRSTVHTMKETNLPVVATYHPAYLLESPVDKRASWDDLLLVKHTLDKLN